MFTDEQIKAFYKLGNNDLEVEIRFQLVQDIITDWIEKKPDNQLLDLLYKSWLQLLINWTDKNQQLVQKDLELSREKRKLAIIKAKIKQQYEELQD